VIDSTLKSIDEVCQQILDEAEKRGLL